MKIILSFIVLLSAGAAHAECDAACRADFAERAADRFDRDTDRWEREERHRESREQQREEAIRRGGCGVTFWSYSEAKRSCKKGRLTTMESLFGDRYYSCHCSSGRRR